MRKHSEALNHNYSNFWSTRTNLGPKLITWAHPYRMSIFTEMLNYSFDHFSILYPKQSLSFFLLPRKSLFLLFRLREPPSRGEGDVGDALRHHRVFHLWPCTRHLWPRPSLRHPLVTAVFTGLEKPCNKEREQKGERRKKGDFYMEVLHVTSEHCSCTGNICNFLSFTDNDSLIVLQKKGTCFYLLV